MLKHLTLTALLTFAAISPADVFAKKPAEAETVAAGKSAGPLDYFRDLTVQEQSDITYIIDTLGHKPLAKLLFYRGSLEQAGDRLVNVHPLSFFAHIFTNDQLISGIRNMRRRGQVWKSYSKGMADSLQEAAERNNLDDAMIENFAHKVGVNSSLIIPSLEAHNWDEFMNTLIKHVQRSEHSDRYDM